MNPVPRFKDRPVWLAAALVAALAAPSSLAANAVHPDRQVVGTRHSIQLPHLDPEIVAAPGREEYRAVCVSCHSARYVPMQPLLTERQWTESVDKMIKVHGASMDAAQRQSIIGYLVATHSPTAKVASADEEESASAVIAPIPTVVPSLVSAIDPAEKAAEAARGAELYRQWCAACHGAEGRGDGVVAPLLFRKPEDLTASRFSREALARALWNGSVGTAMPSWRGLAESNLVALVTHVQSLHRTPLGEPAAPESLRRGAEVFQVNCVPCHGPRGEGDGPNATALFPKPANFTGKQPDRDFLLRVLETGVEGTGMPSWRDPLPAADRAAVADYVRSLFVSDHGVKH